MRSDAPFSPLPWDIELRPHREGFQAFKAAGVSTRTAHVLVYGLGVRDLAQLRAIPLEDTPDGRPGLERVLSYTPGCGKVVAAAIRELHAGR